MNYTSEILQSIRDIDTITMEYESKVVGSMIDAYAKAAVILEYAMNDSDTSSFDIFQESFIMEADDSSTDNTETKQEKLIIKILLFIPRLIRRFVDFLKKKWDNRKSQRLIKTINELSTKVDSMSAEQKKQAEDILKNNASINKNSEDIEKTKKSKHLLYEELNDFEHETDNKFKALVETTKRHDELIDMNTKNIVDVNASRKINTDEISKLRKQFNDETKDARKDSRELHRQYDELYNITTNSLHSEMNFNGVIDFYNKLIGLFNQIGKTDIHKPSTYAKFDMRDYNFANLFDFEEDSKRYKLSEVSVAVEKITKLNESTIKLGTELADSIDKQLNDYKATLTAKGKFVNAASSQMKQISTIQELSKNINALITRCGKVHTYVAEEMQRIEKVTSSYSKAITKINL